MKWASVWMPGVFESLVGCEVDVKKLGRCVLASVDVERKVATVRTVDGDVTHDVSFAVVSITFGRQSRIDK